MYDQNECAESAIEILRTRIDGNICHTVSGNVSRFTTAYPFVLDGEPVSKATVIAAIEGEGFQVRDSNVSNESGRARFDALPADSSTFIVERIGMTPSGRVVIMQRHVERIVEFDAVVAFDPQHLALTQPGDRVTTMSMHGVEGTTGFRNRTLDKTQL